MRARAILLTVLLVSASLPGQNEAASRASSGRLTASPARVGASERNPTESRADHHQNDSGTHDRIPGPPRAAPDRPARSTTDSLVVQTTFGPVEGFQDARTLTWLGVPFAAPPMGAMRWKPPVDPTPWTAVRPAMAFADACPQFYTDGTIQGSEDCLYLNVWKPPTASATPRPIMVWVYGGGNESGATSDFLYGGANLAADNDVIVVSIGYRLNTLGWFYHEALHDGDPATDSGNFGLLDIMKALAWVRKNGAAFGGDPSNITAFGESAGGMNLWGTLLSPLGEGLFDRVILQSSYPQRVSTTAARAVAQKVLEAMVVADDLATEESAAAFLEAQGEPWIRSYLFDASYADLLAAAKETTIPFTAFYAISDGYVQPADIDAALATGAYNRVPMLLGSNRDEMKAFVFPFWLMNAYTFDKLMESYFGDAAAEIEALYPRGSYSPATCYNRFADIMDNQLELFGGEYLPSLVASDVPTWVYHFHYDALKKPFDYAMGAGHGLEMPFVFANMQESFYPKGSEAERQALIDTMQGYWTCFAKVGDPSACSSELRPWPQFTAEGTDKYQRMVIDAQTRIDVIPPADVDRINYWLEYYGRETLPMMNY